MSKINDGGSAFARPYSERQGTRDGTQIHSAQEGMSLRDYFAAKAANGLCSNETWLQEAFSNVGSDACASAVAKASYELADAMLAAREVAK